MNTLNLLRLTLAAGLLVSTHSAQVILKRWPNYPPFNAYADTIPDIDGDGFRELVYGDVDWFNPAGGGGRIRWVSGRTGAPLHDVESTIRGECLGDGLRTVGDVTGDGFPD